MSLNDCLGKLYGGINDEVLAHPDLCLISSGHTLYNAYKEELEMLRVFKCPICGKGKLAFSDPGGVLIYPGVCDKCKTWVCWSGGRQRLRCRLVEKDNRWMLTKEQQDELQGWD